MHKKERKKERKKEIHQSTTSSLSQTIWPRWASRQFLSLPKVQTLLPVTWLFSKLRGCRYVTIEEMKDAVTKVIDTLTQEDVHGAFQKLLERLMNYYRKKERKKERKTCRLPIVVVLLLVAIVVRLSILDTRALQPEEITSKGTRVSCVYHQ